MTIHSESLGVRQSAVRLDLRRYLPSIILAGYGVFILSLLARGALTLYINPAYVLPTTTAGVALIVLAGARLVRQPAAACCDDGCGCEEAPIRLWPYAALAVPLLLAILLQPRGLAASAALQRGPQIAGLTAVRGLAPIHRVSLAVDTRSFTLQDWAGALSADPNPNDYKGKPVQISGMVLHNPGSVPAGYFMVMRYQVTCCIADARPVGLIVRDTSHGALKDNQWVKVAGVMGATSYQGQKVAVVDPKQMVQIKPGNPYMY